MKRREKREFLDICRHLATEDPELAKLLSQPVDRTAETARTIGRIMLWSSMILMIVGLLFGGPLVFGLGLLLVGTWWLPVHMVRRGSPLGGPL